MYIVGIYSSASFDYLQQKYERNRSHSEKVNNDVEDVNKQE